VASEGSIRSGELSIGL